MLEIGPERTSPSSKSLAPRGFDDAAFEAFLASRLEPAWLTEHRRRSWDAFRAMELPSRNHEEWSRTDIRLFRWEKFSLPGKTSPPENAASTDVSPLLSVGMDLAGATLSVDSKPRESRLDEKFEKQGVLFGSLDTMVAKHGDLIRHRLESGSVDTPSDKFAALQTAAWSGGTFLYVPRGVVIDRPLHAISALSKGGADFGRLLVILEEGAEATLLAEMGGGADSGLHCGAIDLFVGPGARLRFVSLQDWGQGVWHFAHNRAVVERDGALQWTVGALGSRLAKVNQQARLVGPGASAQVNGAMFTEGRQHLSYHTLQRHEAPACVSDLLYKGALQDHSRIVWRGMIRVEKDAQKTNAYQRDDNLILSEGARADSIPGLEIEADDVRCTHGATTGRVDDSQIFYARCRGLTRKEATRMIVAGFFQQVFDRITIEGPREALGEAIGRRIREYA